MFKRFRRFAHSTSNGLTSTIIQKQIDGKQWVEALEAVRCIQKIDSKNPIIKQFTSKLLHNNELITLYRFYASSIKLQYPVSEIEIGKWIDQLIKSTSADDYKYLAIFFEKYILYTGETSPIKKPAIKLNDNQLFKLRDFYESKRDIKMYSKIVAYHIKSLKERGLFTEAEKLRFVSKLSKLNLYIQKLGAETVLQNGMFYRFKIVDNKAIRVKHLTYFIEAFSKELATNIDGLNVGKLIYYIELMNGMHIQPHKSAFSKDLNPDLQMMRIYRWIIENNERVDKKVKYEYEKLLKKSQSSLHKHMKDGLPQKLTLNQRFNNDKIVKDTKFSHLSLSIVLKSLNTILQSEKDLDLHNIPEMGVLLFTLMVRKRGIKPSPSCFDNVIALAQGLKENSSSTIEMLTSIRNRTYPSLYKQ